MSASEAEHTDQTPDKEQRDDEPEEVAQEQQRQQEQAKSKSPKHGNPLFLSVYTWCRGNRLNAQQHPTLLPQALFHIATAYFCFGNDPIDHFTI